MAKVFDLGHQSRGETLEVTLRGSGANVMLVDGSNRSNSRPGAA
jgi:hypothetical protein